MGSDSNSPKETEHKRPTPKLFYLSKNDYFLKLGLVFYISLFVTIIIILYLSSMGLVRVERDRELWEYAIELLFWFAATGLPVGLILICIIKYNLSQIDVTDDYLLIYLMKPPLAYLPQDQSKSMLYVKEEKEVVFEAIQSASCRKGGNFLEFIIHLENDSIIFKTNKESWGLARVLENEGIRVQNL